MSAGEIQLLAVIQVLVRSTGFVVLEEGSSGLDLVIERLVCRSREARVNRA